jgi:hypothetical protein
MRNYGVYGDHSNQVTPTPFSDHMPQIEPTKAALRAHTDVYFRGYDQDHADYYLFKEWEREFDQYVAQGTLPNLSFVRFPHDHFGNFTSARFGVNTPDTQMADNDYAVALLIEKVAKAARHNNLSSFREMFSILQSSETTNWTSYFGETPNPRNALAQHAATTRMPVPRSATECHAWL